MPGARRSTSITSFRLDAESLQTGSNCPDTRMVLLGPGKQWNLRLETGEEQERVDVCLLKYRERTIWMADRMPRKLVMTHRLWTGILRANWTGRFLVTCARGWRGKRKGGSDTARKVLIESGRIGQYGLVHYIGRETWQKVTGRCRAMAATGAVGEAVACRRAG